jgi:carboxymethylenebutenolidase
MSESLAAIEENTIAYEAVPDVKTAVPAILVLHESTGVNEYIKDVTRVLAKEGFAGIAVDLYRGRTAASYEEGLQLLREQVTSEVVKRSIESVIRYLQSQKYCSGRLGVLGFGVGGGFALMMACEFSEQIGACALFYPRLDTLDGLDRLQSPVFVAVGAHDEKFLVPIITTLKPALQYLRKRYEIKVYDGAAHGFHRHTTPRVYSEEAAKDAFGKTVELFRTMLI